MALFKTKVEPYKLMSLYEFNNFKNVISLLLGRKGVRLIELGGHPTMLENPYNYRFHTQGKLIVKKSLDQIDESKIKKYNVKSLNEYNRTKKFYDEAVEPKIINCHRHLPLRSLTQIIEKFYSEVADSEDLGYAFEKLGLQDAWMTYLEDRKALLVKRTLDEQAGRKQGNIILYINLNGNGEKPYCVNAEFLIKTPELDLNTNLLNPEVWESISQEKVKALYGRNVISTHKVKVPGDSLEEAVKQIKRNIKFIDNRTALAEKGRKEFYKPL